MTISSNGKVAYVYQDSTDTWHPVAGTTSTGANYAWTGTHSFGSAVSLTEVLTAKAGVNNFLNTATRDAALPSPTNGIVCFVRQNSNGNEINELQYYDNAWRSLNDATTLLPKTASYTAALTDAGKTVTMDVASANTVTIPTNASVAFPIGSRFDIVQIGAGQTQIDPVSVAVTIYSKNSNKKIAARYSGCTIIKTDTNAWVLIGDLTA
jgi:hypothetical protein